MQIFADPTSADDGSVSPQNSWQNRVTPTFLELHTEEKRYEAKSLIYGGESDGGEQNGTAVISLLFGVG